jgi:BASS family bile acid:Na+ symporter
MVGDAAAFLLLSALVAVVYIPLVTPLVASGLERKCMGHRQANAGAADLLLSIGLMLQGFATSAAARLQPIAKRVTMIVTIVVLILIVFVYGEGFVGAAGSYALATELMFFALAIAATCAIGSRLPHAQPSALALGISTRNVGARWRPCWL